MKLNYPTVADVHYLQHQFPPNTRVKMICSERLGKVIGISELAKIYVLWDNTDTLSLVSLFDITKI